MKNLIFLIGILFLVSCGQETEAQQTETTTQAQVTEKGHLTVYDFHTKRRCKTCVTIENTTKEVLNQHFASQMADNTISFELIDAEDPKNENLVEEFGAFGTTLALCIDKGKSREIIDITTWAFQKSGSDKFVPELKEKIDKALAKL